MDKIYLDEIRQLHWNPSEECIKTKNLTLVEGDLPVDIQEKINSQEKIASLRFELDEIIHSMSKEDFKELPSYPTRAGWTQEQKDAFIEKRAQQYNRIKEIEKELEID